MEITAEEIEPIIREVIDIYLIPAFKGFDMNATGQWIDTVEARGDAIWGQPYTEQLVYGRKPGKFPPKEPIIQWAMAKFGVGRQEAERIQYPIRKKIAEEGTKWYQEGGTNLLQLLDSNEVKDYINRRLQEILTKKVKMNLVRYTKLAFR